MKNIIIIFSLIFLLLACKREKMWFNDTTVEGYLLDSATLEPFKDVKVQLYRYHRTGMLFPTSERKLIKTKYTDEDGSFIIKFNSVGERVYYVSFYSVNDKLQIYNYVDEYKVVYIKNKRFIIDEVPIDTILTYSSNLYLAKW